MSAKHTPAPWFVDGVNVKDDPYNRIRYSVVATGKTIANMYYSSYAGGPTNAVDDARLIASAPELLAALRKIEMAASFAAIPDAQERRDMDAALETARAAIAKAEGA
jgi:hypothetical protein